MQLSSTFRQFAALCCAGIFAWDYNRDPGTLQSFSIWTLIIHFIYFQLPLKSRALSYIHPLSFTGSNVIPLSYIHLLFWKPNFEMDHMEQWDISFKAVVIRSILIHFLPVLFHALDITISQSFLIASYQSQPKKFTLPWSFFSFFLFSFTFDLIYVDSDEFEAFNGLSVLSFLWQNRFLTLIASVFSFIVLYMLILRHAYFKKKINRT
jgi:hypothetical protein